MPKHVLWIGDAQERGQDLVFTGDEARHAQRVKRVKAGEVVLALDGTGVQVTGEVVGVGRELVVRILESKQASPPSPAVEVWAPMPKGSASGDLVDMLSQVGAASWIPMATKRSVSPLSEAKRPRLERVAVEACKQSRRAWVLEVGRETPMRDALCKNDTPLLIADQGGAPVRSALEGIAAPGRVRLLVGPEGGFTDEERSGAIDAGAVACSFGPHVLRIEVAAAVGCASVLDTYR